MTLKTDDMMMEILKDLQQRMSSMEKGIARIHLEIAALGQQVAGLTTAVYSGHGLELTD